MSSINFTPFFLSLKLALLTTLILFFIGLPLAWKLAQSHSRFKPFIESIIAMPLVLPPTVLGFYLLWLFSSDGVVGSFLKNFDIELLFSFQGLVIASVLYSLPFMVQPLQSGFEAIPKSLIEASLVSGKGWVETFLRVILPNMKPSLITASIITFAHTIGEFGVVLMVGGSIEGKTKVASIAIYEYVEMLDYKSAHIYSAIMVLMSFLVLLLVYILNHRYKRVFKW